MAAREMLASLLEQSIGETLENISQQQVPTAGGSAAALTGAVAAALTSMVARSTRGAWDGAGGAIAQADTLRARLCALVTSDAAAYEQARRMLSRADDDRENPPADVQPASLTREREQRDFELAGALAAAAVEPLTIAEASADVASLAAWAVEFAGADERPDALVAATIAEAAAFAASRLVLVNLAVRADDDLASRAQAAAQAAADSRSRALAGI